MLFLLMIMQTNDNANYINSGFEISMLNNLFFIRAGINSLFLAESEKEYSFGLGLNVPGLKNNKVIMNYSFESLEYLGSVQQVGISLKY